MSAIGAVEDALGAAEKARRELADAADVAEGEGQETVAAVLRQLYDQQDVIVAGLSKHREWLRAITGGDAG